MYTVISSQCGKVCWNYSSWFHKETSFPKPHFSYLWQSRVNNVSTGKKAEAAMLTAEWSIFSRDHYISALKTELNQLKIAEKLFL